MSDYIRDLMDAGRLEPCPKCGSFDALREVLVVDGPQHAAIVCDNCPNQWSRFDGQSFVMWGPKPANIQPSKPKRRDSGLLHALRAAWGDEPLYCLICLRDERYLDGTHMEAHHVLEHQDGGSDHPDNLQPLCRECHELIHWRRKSVHGAQVAKPEVAHA